MADPRRRETASAQKVMLLGYSCRDASPEPGSVATTWDWSNDHGHFLGALGTRFHYRVHPGPGLVGAHDAPGHGNGASPDPLMTMAVVSFQRSTARASRPERHQARTHLSSGAKQRLTSSSVLHVDSLRYWRQRSAFWQAPRE